MISSWKYLLGGLVLTTVVIWLAVFGFPDNNLHLVACDVGQGDGLLISQGSSQILVDAGPDNRVLACLGKHLPFWDKKIEVVILSHSQKDHFGGLIEVLKAYETEYFFLPKLEANTQEYQVLKSRVGGESSRVRFARAGQEIGVGKISLEIVWPTEQFLAENTDQNDLSTVVNVNFGQFNALLTGDISEKITPRLLEEQKIKNVEYLKVPHHGSKNGLSRGLLETTKPEMAIISVGKNNSYGHPHQEVLKLLGEQGVKILRTDEMGEIEVVSDGESFWIKK